MQIVEFLWDISLSVQVCIAIIIKFLESEQNVGCHNLSNKTLNTLLNTDLAQPLHSHWDIGEQVSSGSELNQVSQRQKCPCEEGLHQIVLQVELTQFGDVMKGPFRNEPHIVGT